MAGPDDSDDSDLPDEIFDTPSRVLRRLAGSWPVRIAGRDDELTALDINEGGIFVAGLVDAPVGDYIELELLLPGHTVHAKAAVRWVRTERLNAAMVRGSGVEFFELTERDLSRLQSIAGGSEDG